MILQRVSPVTHSIGNCLKRVIVIVASVIFFQNPMGRQNQIGAPPVPPLRTARGWAWLCTYLLRGCPLRDVHAAAMCSMTDGIMRVMPGRSPERCQHARIVQLRPLAYTQLACAGTAIALAGVFAYSQVKRLQKMPAAA